MHLLIDNVVPGTCSDERRLHWTPGPGPFVCADRPGEGTPVPGTALTPRMEDDADEDDDDFMWDDDEEEGAGEGDEDEFEEEEFDYDDDEDDLFDDDDDDDEADEP